jgi:hypothetical protein
VGERVATDGAFVGEAVTTNGAFVGAKEGIEEESEPSLGVRLASASAPCGPWLMTRIPKRASKMGLLPAKSFIIGMKGTDVVVAVLYECAMWFC